MGHEDLCHFGITVQTLPAHAVKLSLEDPDPCQPWLCLLCHNASHHLLLASGSSPQHSQPSNQKLPFRSGILRAATAETAPGWSGLRAARTAPGLKLRSPESLSTAGHPQMSCLGHSRVCCCKHSDKSLAPDHPTTGAGPCPAVPVPATG